MSTRLLCNRGSLARAFAAAALVIGSGSVAAADEIVPQLRGDRMGYTVPDVISVGDFTHQNRYRMEVLVSDGADPAPYIDPNLVNPWGIARSPAGPWWVANAETGTSTVYDGTGKPQRTVTVHGAPTGTVYHGGHEFLLSNDATHAPALFLFASEDGTISAWSPQVPGPAPSSMAVTVIDNSKERAIYKGLAIGEMWDGAERLYATDFHNGRVDVFDGSFNLVDEPDAFVDPEIPEGYAPFGIRNIDGLIFVTYAKQDEEGEDDVAGKGFGFVSVFETDGNFIVRVASHGKLNAPWGLALAPENFGRFSGDLLVGNFGSGRILAIDRETFTPRGILRDKHGKPIEIEGLWGLDFGNNGLAGPATSLYFTAGPDDEEHGLFGTITP